jgi:hypothetical protein
MAKAAKKKATTNKPAKLKPPTLVTGQFGEVIKVKLNPPKVSKKAAVKKGAKKKRK